MYKKLTPLKKLVHLYHTAESNRQTNFKKVESYNEFCNLLACKLKRPHWWYRL